MAIRVQAAAFDPGQELMPSMPPTPVSVPWWVSSGYVRDFNDGRDVGGLSSNTFPA